MRERESKEAGKDDREGHEKERERMRRERGSITRGKEWEES